MSATNAQRLTWILLGALTIAAVAAIGMITTTRNQLEAAEAETAAVRADLERIEAAAGNVATQVAIFSNALGDLGPETGAAFDDAIVGLDEFVTSQIIVDIDVSETVAIDTEFVLDREIVVPIATVVPINETIKTTILIDGPFDTQIPIDVEVPITLDLPIDLDVPIAINETIPIAADIPVDLTVPITIDVADTELASFADALRAGLAALRDALTGFDAN